MRLQAKGVELAYEDKVIARNLSIGVPDGKISVLIGPNGSGKSTALRALARLLKPGGGEVVLDGRSIQELSTKDVARRLAILPQLLVAPESITVEELVWFGRHPYRRPLLSPGSADKEAVEWALEVTGSAQIRDRQVDQISGGQRQRAWIALCLAQGTDLILLDEPTTFLDIAYQMDVLDLLHDLNRKQQKTIVMVLHDVNQAAEYAEHVFVLSEGTLVTEGPPEEVLTCEMMSTVFGIESQILAHPVSGKPLCVPIKGRQRSRSDAPFARQPSDGRRYLAGEPPTGGDRDGDPARLARLTTLLG
jgi:iron complex transport system ATP-binding protein